MTPEQWRRIVNTNLRGVVHGSTSACTVLITHMHSHIVNTVYLATLIREPMETAYAAMRHSVAGLSTPFRAEAAGLGPM